MKRTWIALSAVALTLLLAAPARARAEEKAAKVDAKAALERMKQLVGEWQAAPPTPWTMTYRLTGGGSAVVETLFPGTEQEMTSVYHLDGDELVMTHYCASGNQPRMKLDRAASKPDKLQFVFTGGTNIQDDVPHAHQGWIAFKDADHFEAEWTRFVKGKPMPGGALPLSMTRKTAK